VKPPEAAKAPAPKAPPPAEDAVRLPEKAKPPEPPKPVAKAEPPKPAPPAKAPEAKPAPAPRPAEAKPEAKAVAKAAPARAAGAATASAGAPVGSDKPERDAYAALAEKWRAGAGGGLGGTDAGSGPVGTGGPGKGGGGELVGVEFLAYRQQVINTIKAQWTNVIVRPGLVAAVRFAISSEGEVADVVLAQSSGNAAYDASAVRAVQHVRQLPPPPARYAKEFHEFVIEFHSEEQGGEGAG
jgi:TonB family protein